MTRQEKVEKIERLQNELKKYDEWFDTLEVGQTIYEELMYDDSPVKVICWDKEKGEVFCSYTSVGVVVEKWIPKYSLNKEVRNLMFP